MSKFCKLDLNDKSLICVSVYVGIDSARMDTVEKTDWCNGRWLTGWEYL